MKISMDFDVPMGHRLPRHKGKCRFPHGHNYGVTVSVFGQINSDGMVMDYHDIKTAAKKVLDRFDHCMILESDDPFSGLLLEEYRIGDAVPIKLIVIDRAPTAENISLLLQHLIKQELPFTLAHVAVEVRETPNTYAAPTQPVGVAPEIVMEVES